MLGRGENRVPITTLPRNGEVGEFKVIQWIVLVRSSRVVDVALLDMRIYMHVYVLLLSYYPLSNQLTSG